MNEIIRAEKIIRTFTSGRETVHALKGVTIQAEEGKLTLLKGRSGSGKTTLMNIMGALDKPDSGQVWLRDKNMTQAGEAYRDGLRRTQIGFIFQSVALISMMSAYENEIGRASWRERV